MKSGIEQEDGDVVERVAVRFLHVKTAREKDPPPASTTTVACAQLSSSRFQRKRHGNGVGQAASSIGHQAPIGCTNPPGVLANGCPAPC